MDTRSVKRNYCIQQWKAIIQDRNNTDLTVDEYCKQNGLSRHSCFYWLRIIREEALKQPSASGFVELSLQADNGSEISMVTPIPVEKPAPVLKRTCRFRGSFPLTLTIRMFLMRLKFLLKTAFRKNLP